MINFFVRTKINNHPNPTRNLKVILTSLHVEQIVESKVYSCWILTLMKLPYSSRVRNFHYWSRSRFLFLISSTLPLTQSYHNITDC